MQEKINFSAQPKKVYLFKEGLFYKLYNQNAMWFTNHIKAYNVNSKFVKTVKQNVYSIGFLQLALVYNECLNSWLTYSSKKRSILLLRFSCNYEPRCHCELACDEYWF
ncbi:hypothetical protein [Gaetbulibacter jejuensis]|uniref:hypothetical protein n=1 Tax=Gaetbulibacter jejuensis TaxID=584607 RepID=UPI003009050A